MGIYTGLTEAELVAKVAELRGKLEELHSGGAVVRVAGEGRMMEFTRANVSGLTRLLDSALFALGEIRGEPHGHAIGVNF